MTRGHTERDAYPGAERFLPKDRDLRSLARAAAGCRGCPLHLRATQAVFGQGGRRARLMLVGEVPGNDEDLAGEPFVGPAGRLLDRALEEAGIDRADTYVTNVVKHFKWEPYGKRRLHKTPRQMEIDACRPWLDAEIAQVAPLVLVALGATAAKALFGRDHRVTRQHGRPVPSPLAETAYSTLHPSAILRRRGADERDAALHDFVGDLRVAKEVLGGGAG